MSVFLLKICLIFRTYHSLLEKNDALSENCVLYKSLVKTWDDFLKNCKLAVYDDLYKNIKFKKKREIEG